MARPYRHHNKYILCLEPTQLSLNQPRHSVFRMWGEISVCIHNNVFHSPYIRFLPRVVLDPRNLFDPDDAENCRFDGVDFMLLPNFLYTQWGPWMKICGEDEKKNQEDKPIRWLNANYHVNTFL